MADLETWISETQQRPLQSWEETTSRGSRAEALEEAIFELYSCRVSVLKALINIYCIGDRGRASLPQKQRSITHDRH